MKVNKSVGGGGVWLDKKAVRNGDLIKIITEAQEMPSNLGGKDQLVAKVRVKGMQGDFNLAINDPSKNALIEAFGDDTTDWKEQVLSAHVEKTIIAGKRGTALYLVPEGFEVSEDDEGYVKVLPKGASVKKEEINDREYPTEDINPDDIPF